MKIVDGKIVEATEKELFDYWLKREFDDVMSFPDFLKQMLWNKVIVIKDDEVVNDGNS